MPDSGIDAVRHGAMAGHVVPGDDPTPFWAPGIATGVGSMPGTDPQEAHATVAGELSDLPHLVELPQRGAGAEMIGRTAAICVDMPVEAVPSGWRLTRRPGRDLQRATDFLAWDLDAAERHFAGAERVKVQVAGPWTLAAQIETPSGNRAVLDSGAVADLAASLAEGLSGHVAELARRLPGTRIAVQVDEPSLPAVLAGTLATASGFGTVSAVEETRAGEVLVALTAALHGYPTIAHCCHADAPAELLRHAGFGALSLDLTGIGTAAARLDPIAEAVEAGVVLLAGLVPTTPPGAAEAAGASARSAPAREQGAERETAGRYDFHDVANPLLDLWRRLGLADARLDQVVVTPTCGLAFADPRWARRALHLARDAARLLADRSAQ